MSRPMALYDIIEHQVAPRFYDRDEDRRPNLMGADGSPHPQVARPKVVATRMVREYVQELYAPAAQSAARLRGG